MSETPAEAPAIDPPGEKIYICPACGTRYDEPTECANGHAPTETVEYDRATVEAADSGDADAQAAVAETAVAAAGTNAGAVEGEATVGAPAPEPTPVPPTPAADNPAGDQPGTGTPPGGMTDQPTTEPAVSTEPATSSSSGTAGIVAAVSSAIDAAKTAIADAEAELAKLGL